MYGGTVTIERLFEFIDIGLTNDWIDVKSHHQEEFYYNIQPSGHRAKSPASVAPPHGILDFLVNKSLSMSKETSESVNIRIVLRVLVADAQFRMENTKELLPRY